MRFHATIFHTRRNARSANALLDGKVMDPKLRDDVCESINDRPSACKLRVPAMPCQSQRGAKLSVVK